MLASFFTSPDSYQSKLSVINLCRHSFIIVSVINFTTQIQSGRIILKVGEKTNSEIVHISLNKKQIQRVMVTFYISLDIYYIYIYIMFISTQKPVIILVSIYTCSYCFIYLLIFTRNWLLVEIWRPFLKDKVEIKIRSDVYGLNAFQLTMTQIISRSAFLLGDGFL